MKRASFLLFVCGVAVVLTGCSIGGKEAREIPEQVVDESKYEEVTEDGVYLGVFNEKFADIEVNGETRMFNLPKKLKEKAEKIKEKSRVTVTYVLTRKGDLELREIKSQYEGERTEKKEEEPSKEEDEKEESKENLVVRYDGSDKEMEAAETEGEDFSLLMLEEYELDGNELNKDETAAKVEFDVEAEIKKERWRAAGELKQYGTLKELKQDDSAFTFYVQTSSEYKEISVKEIDGTMVRITTTIPLDEKNKSQAEIQAMIQSMEMK
jgi:hypothetical protein